ncbi:hypothetical protein TNCV_1017211 [Trichonephila clavipes]|uniref:Uncharacterized protein n=1 Tax=Trichonephila clavipes TaxID=2585209 RepID=A0A8X7BA07_TRICX|nr:hypothetical protein TNCV_1017211 [Trichonephila clavipes]
MEEVQGTFFFTLYKRSDDSHLRDEQQLLYLTLVYQPQRSRCFFPGLDSMQLFVNQHHIWRRGTNVFHEVDDVTAEKF